MLQGSGLDPFPYNTYTVPLDELIEHLCARYHFNADDAQLWAPGPVDHDNPEYAISTIRKLEQCVDDILEWMNFNKLKLKMYKSHKHSKF